MKQAHKTYLYIRRISSEFVLCAKLCVRLRVYMGYNRFPLHQNVYS